MINQVSNTVRVIECADHHQWIIQRYVGNRWRAEKFFRTRAALVTEVQDRGLEAHGLLHLPDNFRPAYKHGQGAAVDSEGSAKENELDESWPRLERLSEAV